VLTGATSDREAYVRWLLYAGWLLVVVGVGSPWVNPKTAALSLSGADMAEFVKFLPQVLNGSLSIQRLLFYLPVIAVTVCAAFLIGPGDTRYARSLRLLALLLAWLCSFQLLPPAWSPASLLTKEFRLQATCLVISWLLLVCCSPLARLPLWLRGSLTAVLALLSSALSAWQVCVVMPAIGTIYGSSPALGWGFAACTAGLMLAALASASLALGSAGRRGPA
jgi:hypothetical protein